MIQLPQSPSTRRALLAGAAAGGVLLGLLVLRMSGGGGDEAAGPAPATTRTSQTTVAQQAPAPEVSPSLVAAPDPFAQLVAGAQTQVAAAGQAVAVPSQAATAAPAAPTTATTQTTRTTTTTTTTTAPAQTAVPPAIQTSTPTVAPDIVSAAAGPAALPGVPVNVCVGEGLTACVATPPATSVALVVSATVTPGAASRPTVVPGVCSNGQGVAVVVDTGPAGTDVGVVLAVVVGGQQSVYSQLVRGVAPNKTVIVGACVAPGVGARAPTLPSGVTALLGALQPVLSVLGAPAGA